MGRCFLSGLILILSMGCGPAYEKSAFKERFPAKEEVLVGEINRKALLTPPHDRWFNERYDRYSPDREVLKDITGSLEEIDSIRVFLGTWCIDSRIEVPKLFKILDENNYGRERVKMTALEFSKTAPDNLEASYGVVMIPTIIFYKNGKELDRFVEYPQETFEEDLAKIVSGAEYRHSYEKQ